jgi:hypothetical protein
MAHPNATRLSRGAASRERVPGIVQCFMETLHDSRFMVRRVSEPQKWHPLLLETL